MAGVELLLLPAGGEAWLCGLAPSASSASGVADVQAPFGWLVSGPLPQRAIIESGAVSICGLAKVFKAGGVPSGV